MTDNIEFRCNASSSISRLQKKPAGRHIRPGSPRPGRVITSRGHGRERRPDRARGDRQRDQTKQRSLEKCEARDVKPAIRANSQCETPRGHRRRDDAREALQATQRALHCTLLRRRDASGDQCLRRGSRNPDHYVPVTEPGNSPTDSATPDRTGQD